MAYSINPNLPRARAIALKMLITEKRPLAVVANRCGVHRSTVWRWKQKWDKLNEHVQLTNDNRPTRQAGTQFRFTACKWVIPTLAAIPRTSPQAIGASIVARILKLRAQLKRCAEVIWHHLVQRDRIVVSLSSVRRILKRNHCFDGARKNRVRPDNPRRPLVSKPGELVETDTIHYICPLTKSRRYVYTVIDLYTRMAYAEIHSRILPGLAAQVILHARNEFGFDFHMVQADNGPEFSRYFTQVLTRHGSAVRHTRLGRPNDNAHIERFNRTIQEECLGSRISNSVATATLQKKINQYIEFYNTERVHLGIQLRIPSQMLQRS